MVSMFASIKSRRSMKIGHVESKTRSNLKKPCHQLFTLCRNHIFSSIVINFLRIIVLIKSQTRSRHVCSKPRSLDQILEKPCVRSRGHIFSSILMKLCKNVCFNEILTHSHTMTPFDAPGKQAF